MRKILVSVLCFVSNLLLSQTLTVKTYGKQSLPDPVLIDYVALSNSFTTITGDGLVRTANWQVQTPTFALPSTVQGFGGVQMVFLADINVAPNNVQITQQQADAIVNYVKQGGIFIGSMEGITITVLGQDAISYISNALLCTPIIPPLSPATIADSPGDNPATAFHPNNGTLLLNLFGATSVPTTTTFATYSNLPVENCIMLGIAPIANPCKNSNIIDFIIPAYPDVLSGVNSCGVKGMAILSGECLGPLTLITAQGGVRSNSQLSKNYAKLIHDFLYNPVAMMHRYQWSAIGSGNYNVNCIPTITSCMVGSHPPQILNTINCSVATFNLNTVVKNLGTMPTGVQLVWFTNNSHSGTPYATPTTASIGTYYAFYYDAVNNCFSDASEAVQVLNCNPCVTQYSQITTITGTNGILSGNQTFTNGNYYIPNNITITGSVTFTDAEVLMGDNVQFTVANNAALNLNGSHFYSCQNMWKGFVAGGSNAKIKLNYFDPNNRVRSCLIEDAEAAIYWDMNNQNPTHTDDVIACKGTIFNRNRDGIVIRNFNASQSSYINGYPFKIYESVFTCRDIPFTKGALNWTNYEDLLIPNPTIYNGPYYGAKFTPDIYQSPFINANNFSESNTQSNLKITASPPQKSQRGIVLYRIATSQANIGISAGWQFRHNINQVFLDSAAQRLSPNPTVFDNLNVGIDAQEANLTLYNCVFQKPNSLAMEKYGVKANYASPTNFLNVFGNAFFDQNIGIFTLDYRNIWIQGASIRSNKQIAETSNKGSIGILNYCNVINNLYLNGNEISNIGIGIYGINYVSPMEEFAGNILITGNYIRETNPYINNSQYALGGEYVNYGIIFNLNLPTRKFGINNTPITISYNTIDKVYNGIVINYLRGKYYNIFNNTIQLSPKKTLTTNQQFGINITGGGLQKGYDGSISLENTITNNTITGTGNLSFNQTGIYLEKHTGANMGCNTVQDLQNGFRFNNLNNNTKFWDNLMKPTNLYGFNLENNGYIGAQGITGPRGSRCTSDNSWGGTNATWQGLGHYKNSISNSLAYNSPFYINNVASPWRNFDGSSFPIGGSTNIYSSILPNPSIFLIPNDNGPNCERCSWTNPVQLDFGEDEEPILESIANGSLEIISDEPQQELYVLQQELYSKLKENDNLAVNSSTLQNFVQANTWGSFDFIYYTEKMVEAKDFSTANLLLQYFPSNNIVDDNYWQYYTWVTNMQTIPNYQPNLADVYAMANKCPYKNSNVVYAARNLYNALTKTYTEFNPDCEPIAARMANKPKTNAGQRIVNTATSELQIYPNPAKDAITIKGFSIKELTITSIDGKVVKHQNGNGLILNKIDVSSLKAGLYIVKCTNTNGTISIHKFIKQ